MRVLTALFIFLLFPSSGFAQGHSAFCGQADSTAASQECLKRHLDSVQKRLNKIYKKLGEGLEGEKLEELKGLQQTWLTYRDSECMWEAERSQTVSLKRTNELSCMARVTEDRADLLTVAYADNEQVGGQREYGSFPRWMNALAKDNGDVFWNYGHRTQYDLDCDGDEEHVMTGIKTTAEKIDHTEEEDAKKTGPYFSKKVVLSVTQNPPTGRPVSRIFEFSLGAEADQKTLCNPNVSLSFGVIPEEKPSVDNAGKTEEKSCRAMLTLADKGCESKTIIWTGKSFELEEKKKPEDVKETKEKK